MKFIAIANILLDEEVTEDTREGAFFVGIEKV